MNEDVSPTTNADFPVSHVSELRGSKMLVAKVTPERRTALAVKKETLFVHNES